MFHDRPHKRKYCRIERERRFQLHSLPPSVDPQQYDRLHDRYFIGSCLRLRRVVGVDGKLIALKLGQKLIDPAAPLDPTRRQMTTIYLHADEEVLFQSLPARKSVKRRYKLDEQGWTFAIDVYEAPQSAVGIIVCEVECDTDEQLASILKPEWACQEITKDLDFSGANIAGE